MDTVGFYSGRTLSDPTHGVASEVIGPLPGGVLTTDTGFPNVEFTKFTSHPGGYSMGLDGRIMNKDAAQIEWIGLTGVLGARLHDLATAAGQWADATFGTPDKRGPIGPLKHLAKEAGEAQANPKDLTEYADCLLLILDASRRAGFTPMQLVVAGQDKLQVNKTRKWATPTSDEPVEHVRDDKSIEPLSMSEEDERRIYNEAYVEYHKGTNRAMNPYDRDTAPCTLWYQGWDDAEREK